MSDDQQSQPPPAQKEEAEEKPATAPVTNDPMAAATAVVPEEDSDVVLEAKDILEIMEYEESQEADADALLGGLNDSVCTYLEGYKPRQALYSCRTCAAETGQDNGVCYACTIHCHDDHDLVELYTKRNFCCDCGNGKFQKKCTLFEAKTPTNHRNSYNQNFKGLYCVCKRPYPPPPGEETQDGEMVQCTLCEDWFHVNHLDNLTKMDKPVTTEIGSQGAGAASTHQSEASQFSGHSQSSFVLFSSTPSATQSTASQQQSEDQDDDGDMREVFCQDCTKKFPFLLVYFYHTFKGLKMPEVVAGECVYQKIRPESIATLPAGAIEFDCYKWREALCQCENCTAFYEEKQIDFLTDFEDTTFAYYEQNREKAQASKKSSDMQIYESAMEHTGGNRDVALIAMKEWTHMKEKMAKWIEEKAQQGEVIRKEDVHAMFQELRENRLFKVPDEAMDTSAEKSPQ